MSIAAAVDRQRLKRDRLQRVQAEMARHDVGALYLRDGMNVQYVLDASIPGGAAFVPAQGEALGLVRPRDIGYVKAQHENVELAYYNAQDTLKSEHGRTANRLTAGLIELMGRHGAQGERLGVDSLNTAGFLALGQAGIGLVDALPILEHARSVKTPDEVEIYRTIGQQYAQVFGAFRHALRTGMTENQLAAVLAGGWYEADGEEIGQLNVCAAENMNPWRRWPSRRPVQEGELVGVDFHARGSCGLRGDVSRTYLVGDRPAAPQRDLYKRAYAYLQDTIDILRPGRAISQVLELAPRVPEKYQDKLYNYGIAHAIGVMYTGYPSVDPRRSPPDDTLKLGQVFAVECYFAEDDGLAVKLEDMVVIGKDGPENLGPEIPFDDRCLA